MPASFSGMAFNAFEFKGRDIKDKDYQVSRLMNYMFSRTMMMFDYEGLPESLPKREMERLNQFFGSGTVFECKAGLVIDKGRWSETPNGYYLPQKSIVTNPYFEVNQTFTDGVDCVITKNDSFYSGLSPMFARYAELIATNEISMYVANILSRIQALLQAKDSNAEKEAKKYLKAIEDGKLSFVTTNLFKDNISVSDIAKNGTNVLTNLIEYEQFLKGSWLNEIGLNAQWNAKREYVGTNESQLNGDFLLPLVDDMFACRLENVEKINKLFGTNIAVKKSSSWEDVQNRETMESEADAATNDQMKNGEEAPEQKGEEQNEA